MTAFVVVQTLKTLLNGHMPRKINKERLDAQDHLLVHARWVAERFERMNEQLLTLASTFIGFLAIELGLLAQISLKSFRGDIWAKAIGCFALFLLFIGIILFFITLLSNNFEIPKLEDFQASAHLDTKEMRNESYRFMISSEESNRNIQKSLEDENIHLNRYYKPALIVSGMAQLLVVTLLIRLWTNN